MKDDFSYLEHILLSIMKIKEFTKDLSKADFDSNELVQDAVIRNIEIIGEATKKISQELKSKFKEIPWREMSGMRDKLVHDYMGTDVEVVWKTVTDDIPLIETLINKIYK
jgi:uncharacterized protein with HEPN domain